MTRRIIAGVVALLVALVGVLGVVTYARGADRRALSGQEAVNAFVAVKEVPVGTTAGKAVADGLIKQELIARKAVPDDVLTTVDQTYSPLVATSTMQPGEVVLRSRFSARAATPGSLPLPAGKLAVSIALDDPSHVGSFVEVGSKVAVFDTFNVQEANTKSVTPAGDRLQDRHEFDRATRLLLPSVEVLAVGATTTPVQDSATANAGKGGGLSGSSDQPTTTLFTLAVTQAEAERLVHAARTGTLTFALLGPDTTATPGAGTDDRSLFEVAK